jgi:hypothetical protein
MKLVQNEMQFQCGKDRTVTSGSVQNAGAKQSITAELLQWSNQTNRQRLIPKTMQDNDGQTARLRFD